MDLQSGETVQVQDRTTIKEGRGASSDLKGMDLTMETFVYSSSASSRVVMEFCLCSSGCDPASFFPLPPRQSAYRLGPDLDLSFRPPPAPSDPFRTLPVPRDRLAGPSLSRSLRLFTHDPPRAGLFPSPPTQLTLGSQVLTISLPGGGSRLARPLPFCSPGHSTTIKEYVLSYEVLYVHCRVLYGHRRAQTCP